MSISLEEAIEQVEKRTKRTVVGGYMHSNGARLDMQSDARKAWMKLNNSWNG